MAEINLDKHFRPDSSARRVAEKLLSGQPYTRQELVEDTHVSITSVNRVLEVLTTAGATFTRDIAEDGRQARFRLVSIGDPRLEKAYPTVSDEAKIVRAEIHGGDTMVDFVIGDVRFRGALQNLSKQPPLGKLARVTGVSLDKTGAAVVALDIRGSAPLHIANVHNVSDE